MSELTKKETLFDGFACGAVVGFVFLVGGVVAVAVLLSYFDSERMAVKACIEGTKVACDLARSYATKSGLGY